MSTSTDGQICFGFEFEEDCEFPWNREDFYDEEDWYYLGLLGYTLEEGDDKYKKYFSFQKENPCPIELVNYISCDYPAYIIAMSGTVLTANRGYPVPINKEHFELDPEKVKAFVNFCKKHFKVDTEPQWFLSSYWG